MKNRIFIFLIAALISSSSPAFAENSAAEEQSQIIKAESAFSAQSDSSLPDTQVSEPMSIQLPYETQNSAPESKETPSPTPEPSETPTAVSYTIRRADLYIWGNPVTLSEPSIIVNDTLLVPIKEFLSNRGVYDFSVDETNQITITYGKKLISMHLDSCVANKNGKSAELSATPVLIGSTVYAPLRFVCESLDFNVDASMPNGILTVRVDEPESPVTVQKKMSEQYVNASNLPSDTKYLIWINKSSYMLYVFLGENGNWREVYSCKCAIGASSTPTITGTFKYFSKEARWSYDKFYVGPIMRFYRGYAIHTTLLNYDGTNYNSTVGAKISHGCIRVRPNDMNWLVSYVPLKTTIHITEN
ncbi:MAG: L,D-transpeptidase family protein [Firmicutes bacterium]|nr:L,D-transpeptidase family protein [Bacillota bacterium]